MKYRINKIKVLTLFILLIAKVSYSQRENISLINFTYSSCDKEADPERLRTRIIKKEFRGDILTIEIGITATCCVTFVPMVSVKNNILLLDFNETGDFCFCDCCYGLIYQIKGIKNHEMVIKFKGADIELTAEKYKTYPIKFEIIKGDTVNYSDKYGFKQGKWFNPDDSSTENGYNEYKDNRIIKEVIFYLDGKIKSIGDDKTFISYYPSGIKKRECQWGVFDPNSHRECKEWNEKGEMIYPSDYGK